MPDKRVVTFDLETVAANAHAERILAEPWAEASFAPRGGAVKAETIARQKEEAEAEFNASRLTRVDACALSPRTGRVVCAGISVNGYKPFVLRAPEELDERRLLASVWADILSSSLLVTWNGFAFDLPYLVVRSVLSGVRHDAIGDRVAPLLWRYNYAPHFDVRMALAAWDMRAQGTRAEWAAAFGFAPQAWDGSAIGALHRAGDHDTIAKHCGDDVSETYAMFTRLAPFYGIEA